MMAKALLSAYPIFILIVAHTDSSLLCPILRQVSNSTCFSDKISIHKYLETLKIRTLKYFTDNIRALYLDLIIFYMEHYEI